MLSMAPIPPLWTIPVALGWLPCSLACGTSKQAQPMACMLLARPFHAHFHVAWQIAMMYHDWSMSATTVPRRQGVPLVHGHRCWRRPGRHSLIRIDLAWEDVQLCRSGVKDKGHTAGESSICYIFHIVYHVKGNIVQNKSSQTSFV